jgi:uncharacterized repeat protein (TIGR01451 family)
MFKHVLSKLHWMLAAVLLTAAVWMLMPAQAAWADCGDTDPSVLCVDTDATGGATGLSWTDAYTNVQDALDEANAHETTHFEIWVAEGVYYPDEGGSTVADSEAMSFTLSYNNVQLYGGFVATETTRSQRDWETYVTVLSGDIDGNDTTDANGVVTDTGNISGSNAYHVLWLDGVTNETITETTVIDGFTITAGQADDSSHPHQSGGGLYCAGDGSGYECSPTLANVTFSGNRARYGGGMFNYGEDGASSPSLTNVTFNGNGAYYSGGGMVNDGSGSGESSPVLTNVTFSGNQADGYNGGGMLNQDSSPTLTNVILWGNTAGGEGNQLGNFGATVVLSYTLIQSGTGHIYNHGSTVTYGDGILTSDPQFVAPITATAAPTTTGDYRLQAGSPAIDAGDDDAINATGVTTDLDGNPRIFGDAVDLGAYEAQPNLALRKTVTPTTDVTHHGAVTYTVVLSNSGVLSDTNVLFTDTLPISTTFGAWVISPTNTLRQGNAITRTGTLTASEALTWTFTAIHTGNCGDVVTNTAEFSGTVQAGEDDAVFAVVGPPEIMVHPSSLAFGSQHVDAGPTLSQTVTITNDGSADLSFTAPITIAGADTEAFAVANDSGENPLPSGNARTVHVSFDPTSAGAKSADLTIQSDDSDEPTVNVGLNGTGVDQEITVVPSSLSFGSQDVDAGPTLSQTVTITNDGSADLSFTAPITIAGADTEAFAIANDSGENPLPSGNARTVHVSFDPTTGGTKSANLTIASDDSDEPMVSIGLNGTGTEAGQPGYGSNPAPDSAIDVGTAHVGSTVTATLSISETGDATLMVTPTLAGPDAAAFGITPSTLTIPDGGKPQDLTIACSPSVTRTLASTLTLAHNATGSPALYPLSCTGEAYTVYLPLVLR